MTYYFIKIKNYCEWVKFLIPDYEFLLRFSLVFMHYNLTFTFVNYGGLKI